MALPTDSVFDESTVAVALDVWLINRYSIEGAD